MTGKRIALTAVLLAAAACGSTTTSPSTSGSGSTPLALAISCPSNVSASSAATTLAVVYATAAATGGTQPVTTSCTPASGSAFPRGANTVTCTATDAAAQKASCTFTVTVSAIPVLTGAKFLAFGDSLTAGEVLNALQRTIVDSTRAYPAVLQSLLLARYTSQLPTVVNAGQSGEVLMNPDGFRSEETRLRYGSALTVNKADAVLLLEGVNDFNSAGITDDQIAGVLANMVDEAFAANAKQVYLATLPPQIPGKLRSANYARVPTLNTLIKAVATQHGATLVDLYAAMIGDVSNLINGDDGLHPLTASYQMMAQTYYTAIRGNFEKTTLLNSLLR